MIDTIWHLRGSTELPANTSDSVILERLETFIAKQDKQLNGQTETSIRFNSPLWENWITNNWLALVIYDRGSFWIESGLEGRTLKYDLRSLHGLIFCLLGALMFLAFVSSFEGFREGARTALLAFAWLYGGNMVLAWTRIPRAIRNAVSGS